MQVLIAEDDPQVRSLVHDVVKDMGHSIACAGNGMDALALYDERGADVVVSDWIMPGLDGVQLCRRMRSRVGAPYTYFILLTALGDSEHRMAVGSGERVTARPAPFSQEDAELLEMLASTAASSLVALEHARLDGVMLAARTAQHELNNQLAVARGYAEILAGSPELPPHLHEIAEEVVSAADDAAAIVRQLRNIASIREQQWPEPGDTTINLARSQSSRGAA